MTNLTAPFAPFSVRGTVLQTPTRDQLEVLTDTVIDIGADGIIQAMGPDPDRTVDVELGPDTMVFPGLVDTHIHAPQWPQLGTGLDLPLEQWLFEYTFPLEASLSDLDFAAEVWTGLVSTLLRHGTTTGVYYGTVDVESTTLLAKTCADLGQRAWVGRVAMDHPEGTPEWYRDADAATAIAASRVSIEQIRDLGSPLVAPIVTPRFIPACTDKALAGLGQLAAETGVLVQTHCSESDWEHGYVLDRHGMTDTESLDRFGLLRPHTVLAHGDHLTDDNFAMLRERGAGVAHCPLSNAYFGNAVFRARRALDAGVRVGLGTDIAGGASPGLLPQCAHAVTASRYLEEGVDPGLPADERGVADSRIDILDAFWLATVGGADLLGAPIGLLEVGRSFDAFTVTPNRPGSALHVWPGLDDDDRRFEKVVRLAVPEDISAVWVAGQKVLQHV